MHLLAACVHKTEKSGKQAKSDKRKMNNVKALAIFCTCATSAPICILFVFGLISTVPPTLAMPDQQHQQHHVIASADMHNLMDHSMAEHSNDFNNIQKYHIMALSPSALTQSNKTNNLGTEQLDQHSFEMENSRKYLHLDEHNFVATTPKIHTTKLPNR